MRHERVTETTRDLERSMERSVGSAIASALDDAASDLWDGVNAVVAARHKRHVDALASALAEFGLEPNELDRLTGSASKNARRREREDPRINLCSKRRYLNETRVLAVLLQRLARPTARLARLGRRRARQRARAKRSRARFGAGRRLAAAGPAREFGKGRGGKGGAVARCHRTGVVRRAGAVRGPAGTAGTARRRRRRARWARYGRGHEERSPKTFFEDFH